MFGRLNYLFWQENLNSDGQQFHRYQQTKHAPLTTNDFSTKRPRHMSLEIQILAWGRLNNSLLLLYKASWISFFVIPLNVDNLFLSIIRVNVWCRRVCHHDNGVWLYFRWHFIVNAGNYVIGFFIWYPYMQDLFAPVFPRIPWRLYYSCNEENGSCRFLLFK